MCFWLRTPTRFWREGAAKEKAGSRACHEGPGATAQHLWRRKSWGAGSHYSTILKSLTGFSTIRQQFLLAWYSDYWVPISTPPRTRGEPLCLSVLLGKNETNEASPAPALRIRFMKSTETSPCQHSTNTEPFSSLLVSLLQKGTHDIKGVKFKSPAGFRLLLHILISWFCCHQVI